MWHGLVAAFLLTGCKLETEPTVPIVVNPGDPVAGLTQKQFEHFTRGRGVFEREFNPLTGLGPLFNSVSCRECHEAPVTGGSGANEQGGDDIETHASRFINGFCDELEAEGGPVFRHQAVNDGPLDNIPPSPELGMGHRTTPPLFGFGFLEAIPDETLIKLQAKTGGHVHRLPSGVIGRFGRKATDPNLTSFIGGAFNKEQGIEIPSELSQEELLLTVAFVQGLAPIQHLPIDKKGQRLFHQVGCTQCHVPTLRTGPSEIAALANKDVDLYSDLLLHEMAAVDMCRGDAKPSEFRTAPLMGMRFLSTFLHDGRAASIEAAIEGHAGQATKARQNFEKLCEKDKARLLKFVAAL